MKNEAAAASAQSNFNNGATPLIMAYIGDDEPERGDSRGTAGLARVIAEKMGGRHIYVDGLMLARNFPELPNIKERLKKLLQVKGMPDIALGTQLAHNEISSLFAESTYQINTYNEGMATAFLPHDNDLVPHHLTPELLAFERARFRAHYPRIEGPLIALLLGDDLCYTQRLADKIAQIASTYPRTTFFLCPSRRTGEHHRDLMGKIPAALEALQQKALGCEKVPRRMSRRAELRRLFKDKDIVNKYPGLTLKDRATIFSVDYMEAIKGYNPYMGLLAAADHIIVAGSSYSLVSEALYTGKSIYLYQQSAYKKMEEKGYVVDLNNINCLKPLPTKKIAPPDTSGEIAQAIIDSYRSHIQTRPARSSSPKAGAPAHV